MTNILKPANLEAAKKANEFINAELSAIEAECQTRKKPSLRQELQKERLQGLLLLSSLNNNEMETFGKLLDPEIFSKEVEKNKAELESLGKDELVQRLAVTILQLEIEQGYANVANRALGQFNHIADGDEYRKNLANDNRQDERNKNFTADNEFLLATLNKLKKRKYPNPLTWNDFKIFKHEVYLNRPEPLYIQEVRLVGEAKDLHGIDLKLHKEVTKEMSESWSDSRLRDFFTSNTGQSPKAE